MNLVCLHPIKFTNLMSGSEDYGFIIYDCYDSYFDFLDEEIPKEEMEFLRMVVNLPYKDERVIDILQSVLENKKPMLIGSTIYDYDQLESTLTTVF